MNEAERRLSEDRTTRRTARGLFDKRLAQFRADYEARGIGGRIKAKAVDEGQKALDQALDVASESKGVIAGTLAALLVWFFRNPILSLIGRALGSGQDPVQEQDASRADEDQEKQCRE